MLLLLACSAPLPDTVTVGPVDPPQGAPSPAADVPRPAFHADDAQPWPDALALTDPNGTCGDPTVPDRLLRVYGDCRAWIGVTASGAIYEGNPSVAQLSPSVGMVTTLVARRDQVIVGGAEGVARRVWIPGRTEPDVWARLPRPVDMTAVTRVDALASSFRSDLWFTDTQQLCHSDGSSPRCYPMRATHALAAMPQGAWVADGEGGLWLVPATGAPMKQVLPGSEPARGLVFDAGRGVLWVASPTRLHALDPATGSARKSWDWAPGAPGEGSGWELALAPGGLRVFGAREERARFE